MKKIILSLFIVFLISIFVNNINGDDSYSGSSSFSGSSFSGSSSGSASGSSINSESSGSSGETSGESSSSSLPTSSSSSGSPNVILPNSENIYYSGRFDKSQSDDFYGFAWSGCSLTVVVTGTTSISIILDSQGDNWFDVFINNAVYSPFNVSLTPHQEYNILGEQGDLDPSQTYTVLVVKRTEAEFGEVRFYGFTIDPSGSFLSSYTPPSRKIEFIGDSITCGYGDLGTAPCNFEPNTEDNYVTYASITARELDCEMYLEAWSGRGVVRNYGSPTPTSSSGTVPLLYPYAIPTDTTTEWDFSNYIPDAVVINLGTNDYSTQPAPSQEQFQNGYIQFINNIKANYNGTPHIFLICGPMISNPCCDYVSNISSIVGATYIDAQNILNEPADIGCNSHPSVLGHTKLAAVVSPVIQKTMGWN